MQRLTRMTAVAVLATMLVPAAALADDQETHRDRPPAEATAQQATDRHRIRVARDTEPPGPVHTTDRSADPAPAPATDLAPDRNRVRLRDPAQEPTTDVAPDRDRVRERDRSCADRVTDARCCPDQPADRVPEHCRDHEPPEVDVNIRKLVWRLIHAEEWEKLFRLLRRLHIV